MNTRRTQRTEESVAITMVYRHQPAVRAPQVCLKKSAHCSWRAKLGEEASCLRRSCLRVLLADRVLAFVAAIGSNPFPC
jgi:hypothetical protein